MRLAFGAVAGGGHLPDPACGLYPDTYKPLLIDGEMEIEQWLVKDYPDFPFNHQNEEISSPRDLIEVPELYDSEEKREEKMESALSRRTIAALVLFPPRPVTGGKGAGAFIDGKQTLRIWQNTARATRRVWNCCVSFQRAHPDVPLIEYSKYLITDPNERRGRQPIVHDLEAYYAERSADILRYAEFRPPASILNNIDKAVLQYMTLKYKDAVKAAITNMRKAQWKAQWEVDRKKQRELELRRKNPQRFVAHGGRRPARGGRRVKARKAAEAAAAELAAVAAIAHPDDLALLHDDANDADYSEDLGSSHDGNSSYDSDFNDPESTKSSEEDEEDEENFSGVGTDESDGSPPESDHSLVDTEEWDGSDHDDEDDEDDEAEDEEAVGGLQRKFLPRFRRRGKKSSNTFSISAPALKGTLPPPSRSTSSTRLSPCPASPRLKSPAPPRPNAPSGTHFLHGRGSESDADPTRVYFDAEDQQWYARSDEWLSPAARGHAVPHDPTCVWTKFDLPKKLGSLIVVKHKVPLNDKGNPLADVTITKDGTGRFVMRFQRELLKESAEKPLEERKCASIDPGVKTPWTVYLPDAFMCASIGNGYPKFLVKLAFVRTKLNIEFAKLRDERDKARIARDLALHFGDQQAAVLAKSRCRELDRKFRKTYLMCERAKMTLENAKRKMRIKAAAYLIARADSESARPHLTTYPSHASSHLIFSSPLSPLSQPSCYPLSTFTSG